MVDRTYLCIDLKSFYASVECVELGLDPFETNLVVADPSRGPGAICLAITPALKKLGINNRCRVFAIPADVEFITAMPRMKLYMQRSAQIYSIYLKYISMEDIHVYSIDECFIDITAYMSLYGKTAREIAIMLMNAVFDETGICATAGIGKNLFLAKVALDITAKHVEDHIGFLDLAEFKRSIWHHRPITDIWNIGRGIAKRLERYGIFDLYDIAHMDEALLYREFGVNAEYLIDHSKGIEPCTIKEIHDYRSNSSSLSNGQILFEDYNFESALLIVKEMVDLLVLELVEKHLVANSISLSIGYSGDMIKPSGGLRKIGTYTNSYKKLIGFFEDLYTQTTDRICPIRRVNIGLNNILDESFASIDLFTDVDAENKERRVQNALIAIKNKYGKNSILKGMSYQEKATARKRNKLVGGHNSE